MNENAIKFCKIASGHYYVSIVGTELGNTVYFNNEPPMKIRYGEWIIRFMHDGDRLVVVDAEGTKQ